MPKSPFDLTGKTALITGSSRGLGHAMALGLAQAGAAIILNGANAERLKAAAETMRAAGHQVAEACFDITDEAGFERVNALGGLSIRIGDGTTCAARRMASPTELRALLLAAAEQGVLTARSFAAAPLSQRSTASISLAETPSVETVPPDASPSPAPISQD